MQQQDPIDTTPEKTLLKDETAVAPAEVEIPQRMSEQTETAERVAQETPPCTPVRVKIQEAKLDEEGKKLLPCLSRGNSTCGKIIGPGSPSTPVNYTKHAAIIPLSDDSYRESIYEEKVIKEAPECTWSKLDPHSMPVRAPPNYAQNKIKKPSLPAIYDCFQFESYMHPQEIMDLADGTRWLPTKAELEAARDFPARLVIACILPTATPSWGIINKIKSKGKGITLIFAGKLSDKSIKIIKDNSEGKAQLPNSYKLFKEWTTKIPHKDWVIRSKVCSRILNPIDGKLGVIAQTTLNAFFGKPMLLRDCQKCYVTENGICIVEVKGYDFSYIARKTLDSMLTRVPSLIYDFGFLIEGTTDDQLPEQVLISARVNKCPFEMAGIWETAKEKKTKKKSFLSRGKKKADKKAQKN